MTIVQLLLSKGADVHVISGRWTAVKAAAENGKADVVELLITSGADINVATFKPQEWTGLSPAAV